MKDDLTYLARKGTELLKDMVLKHEDGEFLPEITYKNPHLHKRKEAVLHSYCDLLIKAGEIFRTNTCKKEAILIWGNQLKVAKSREQKLLFDSQLIEIGGDH